MAKDLFLQSIDWPDTYLAKVRTKNIDHDLSQSYLTASFKKILSVSRSGKHKAEMSNGLRKRFYG